MEYQVNERQLAEWLTLLENSVAEDKLFDRAPVKKVFSNDHCCQYLYDFLTCCLDSMCKGEGREGLEKLSEDLKTNLQRFINVSFFNVSILEDFMPAVSPHKLEPRVVDNGKRLSLTVIDHIDRIEVINLTFPKETYTKTDKMLVDLLNNFKLADGLGVTPLVNIDQLKILKELTDCNKHKPKGNSKWLTRHART